MSQKPQLAIQYPTKYASVFEPLNDFEVWDYTLSTEPPKTSKALWIDVSRLSHVPVVPYDFQGIILPMNQDAERNVLDVARNYLDDKVNIALWHGGRRQMNSIASMATVALPYWHHPRTWFISEEDCHEYHYYEFCNLDELRRLPPKSMQTSMPILAALLGIDLTRRERRPRKVPEFTYDLTLTTEQLELAVNNVHAIRTALEDGYARLNPTLHT